MGSSDVTPMMAQYLAIKARHPDALLFYRMGDFYEMFFEDAAAAAAALDIALTSRGEHLGRPIPMCGVPVVRADDYLLALIRKGFRVAVAEQLEDPAVARRRGAKAVVARDVVRLVTPGTLTEEGLLEARHPNYLAALARVREESALAWCDISTGELCVTLTAQPASDIARIGPRELLVPEDLGAEWLPDVFPSLPLVRLSRVSFDSAGGERRLMAMFGVGTLAGFGDFGRAELSALGAVAHYLDLTQKGCLPNLRPPVREATGSVMEIDAATRRNLEITTSLSGTREGSLLWAIDRSVTAAGGRAMQRRLSAPLRDPGAIAVRLDAVEALVRGRDLRQAVRAELGRVPEIERAMARLAMARGGPRDLCAVRDGLAAGRRLADLLRGAGPALPAGLREAAAAILRLDGALPDLDGALVQTPPLLLRDGGVIANGFDRDLDEARAMRDEGRGFVARMQAELVSTTGIGGLRIRHNAVLGYFVEVSTAQSEKLRQPPLEAVFRHRQTTADRMRFTTPELAALEGRILTAAERAQEIEERHFARLSAAVSAEAGRIGAAASALAEIDVAAALAEIADAAGWCRPMVDESRAFMVQGGRHPVVEAALSRSARAGFVPNDCMLSAGSTPAFWLLTGPNMAGKSTFLRQNALIALLAQAGSFVPARSARIGMVSRLFSRVGAADDLARGQSTFLVEMVETAAILNQADEAALVILDEIGRGTATWDGLSIAWAVLEHLCRVNRCRGFFATHYHELTALSGTLPGLSNATVAVREWEGEVIFLHEVRPGSADRSYGVQVARLAGLPPQVVRRARHILSRLEARERARGAGDLPADDLPLFAAGAPSETVQPPQSAVENRLSEVDPDTLAPRQALDLIYELRALIGR